MTNIVPINQLEPPSIPDVGWLIQNDLISDETLCAELLEGYSAEIERLAFTLLKSPPDLLDVVNQTIAQAILNRKRYSGEVPGRPWLINLALVECLRIGTKLTPGHADVYDQSANLFSLPAQIDPHSARIFQELGQKNSLLVVLHHGFELNEEEIAYLLGRRVDQIQFDLQNLVIRLREHQETCPACLSLAARLPDLAVLISSHLQAGRPGFNFSEENRSNWKASILRRVARLRREQQSKSRRTQAVQVGVIVVALLFVVGLVNTVWSRKPEAPGSASFLSQTLSPRLTPSLPIPRSQARRPVQLTPVPAIPIAATPDISAMVKLANSSLNKWRSLWADVQVINYGPYDNASIRQITRKQLWVSQPFSERIISGPATGSPFVTSTITTNHLFIQNFQNGQTSDSLTSDLIQDADLQKLFLPYDMFIPEGVLKYVGTEVIANRPVWILDRDQGEFISHRYGIDQEYGVLLYASVYGGKDMKTVLSDTIVTSIYFNPQISPSIFDPGQYLGDHFANDFSGEPEIINVQKALAAWTAPRLAESSLQATPQPKFDPSGSQLSLLDQSAIHLPVSAKSGPDLFADGIYLGQLPLGGSALLTCERSPDGGKIAYNSVGDGASGDTALMLAELSSLQTAHLVMPDGFTSGDFAFAPDGKRLAFYGCDKPGGFCGVFILDLTTSKLTRLLPLLYADYLFWSPDGHYLAMVGAQDGQALMAQKTGQNMLLSEVLALSQPWYFFVMDTSNSNIVFKQQFEWTSLKAPADSPTNSWSTPFKVQTGGFAGCVNPPVK